MQSGDLYNAYGTKLSGNPTGDPFGFCAQAGSYTDSETGLRLMGLRYYDPSAGRFLTRDPSGYAGGANLYDYTENNPGNYTDPMGLNKIPLDYVLHGAGQALIGAGKGLIIVGGVVLLAPELGTAIAIGGVAYGGYKLGQGIYSMASGQEWSMDGNGPQMTDCEWASNLGSTVVGIGLLFGGAALADGAGGAGEGGAPEGEGEPAATGGGAPRTVFSGHGGFTPADGQVQVPDGTSINFYGAHGYPISDSLGNEIELGNATPFETFNAGDTIPNYTLYPPGGLNIIMNEGVFVTSEPITLSDLFYSNMGVVDWAACRCILLP